MIIAGSIYLLAAIAFYVFMVATAKFEPQFVSEAESTWRREWLEAKRSQQQEERRAA